MPIRSAFTECRFVQCLKMKAVFPNVFGVTFGGTRIETIVTGVVSAIDGYTVSNVSSHSSFSCSSVKPVIFMIFAMSISSANIFFAISTTF